MYERTDMHGIATLLCILILPDKIIKNNKRAATFKRDMQDYFNNMFV